MAAFQNEGISRTIQQDWANREYIEIITGSIKKIADFLNSFDRSCRGRLALLNEKLTSLERTMEYLEAKVSKGEISATTGGSGMNHESKSETQSAAGNSQI